MSEKILSLLWLFAVIMSASTILAQPTAQISPTSKQKLDALSLETV